jgi:arylsulfatase A-like enzyme
VTAPRDANVVLIVNDAMRRDRMSAYGGPARTPSFEAFAAAHLLFRSAVTQAPWTKPSIATLFTGRLPADHGLVDHPEWRPRNASEVISADVLGEDFVTLSETLRAHGFRTAGFVANPWMDERFGFAQGFETWDDSFAGWDAPGEQVNAAARTWLDALDPGARFFVYVHYIDTHRPYGRLDPAEVAAARARIEADPRVVPVRERTEIALTSKLTNGRSIVTGGATLKPALVEMAYDRGVEDFDRAFGDLIATLSARPDWSRTAVIATSDHGEALFERGYGNHGRGLHQDEAAIPLAARLPGVRARGSQIDCPVGLVDVLPTVCAYLGIPCPDGLAGASFLRGAGGAGPPRFLTVEGVPHHPSHRAVVGERYKLIHEPDGRTGPGFVRDPEQGRAHPSALYDLDADPGERTDLLANEPRPPAIEAAARELREALDAIAARPRAPAPASTPIDPALAERLRALGYLSGEADERPQPGAAPPEPE